MKFAIFLLAIPLWGQATTNESITIPSEPSACIVGIKSVPCPKPLSVCPKDGCSIHPTPICLGGAPPPPCPTLTTTITGDGYLFCNAVDGCKVIPKPSISTEPRKETMDPLTAAMNAFAAFNQFLCTPAGQKLAMDQEAIFATLMSHFGVHLAPNAAQVAAAAGAGAAKAQ